MHAIRTSSRKLVDAVHYLIQWPLSLSADWCKGYLAGIFDAEGSHNSHTIRIANTHPAIQDYLCRSLNPLGFEHALPPRYESRERPVSYVRLRAGPPHALRFLHRGPAAVWR